MEILCILMLIWLIVIQVDINNLKDKIKLYIKKTENLQTNEPEKISEETQTQIAAEVSEPEQPSIQDPFSDMTNIMDKFQAENK